MSYENSNLRQNNEIWRCAANIYCTRMIDTNDPELVVEFDFYKLISADSKYYSCDFHKVLKGQTTVFYRVVLDTSAHDSIIVDIGKGDDGQLDVISEEGTIGIQLKEQLYALLVTRL